MTIWRDFALNVAYTHTWMTYIHLIAIYLDFPEILALRVPLPTLVLATRGDPFFTFKEVQLATSMLKKIYRKARVPESLQEKFYGRSHKFDRPMQVDAIHWLDRWLK